MTRVPCRGITNRMFRTLLYRVTRATLRTSGPLYRFLPVYRNSVGTAKTVLVVRSLFVELTARITPSLRTEPPPSRMWTMFTETIVVGTEVEIATLMCRFRQVPVVLKIMDRTTFTTIEAVATLVATPLVGTHGPKDLRLPTPVSSVIV